MAGAAEDQTLATVCLRAANPIEYVRRVLENMQQHPRDSKVRVSIVDVDKPADYIVDDVMDDKTGQSEPAQGYDGTTHRYLSPKKHGNGWTGWSRAGMDRKQVSSLLGALRKYKPLDKSVAIPALKKKGKK